MTIRIQVTGVNNHGKTTVTAIIAEALKAQGFEDVYVLCEDGDLQNKAAGLQEGMFPTEAVKQQLVVVDDLNGKRFMPLGFLGDGVITHYTQAGAADLHEIPPPLQEALQQPKLVELNRPVRLSVEGGSINDRALLAAAVRYGSSLPIAVSLTRGEGHDLWTETVAKYGRLRGAREPLPFDSVMLNVDLSES